MPKKRKAAQPPTVASLVKQLCDESIEDAEQEAAAHALAQMAAEDDEKAKRVARALRSTEGSVEAVAALLASDACLKRVAGCGAGRCLHRGERVQSARWRARGVWRDGRDLQALLAAGQKAAGGHRFRDCWCGGECALQPGL